MTLVVGDTAPLRYLVEISHEDLLPQLFVKVWIPGAVSEELRHKQAPAVVRRWAEHLPGWIEVREVQGGPSEHELAGLDRGEWEAIQLARALGADLLLIDERAGARLARQEGFAVTGTLGVLVEAAKRGLISIDDTLTRLGKTNFRRTPSLFAEAKDLIARSGKRGS